MAWIVVIPATLGMIAVGLSRWHVDDQVRQRCRTLAWICLFVVLSIAMAGGALCSPEALNRSVTSQAAGGGYLYHGPFFLRRRLFLLSLRATPIRLPPSFLSLGLVFRKGQWILLILIAINGLSRVVDGAHYPSDVLFGVALAALMTSWLHLSFCPMWSDL